MILVTGGAGYIGSHTCVALANSNIPFIVFDNFSNSRHSVIERMEKITGINIRFIEGDVRDKFLLNFLIEKEKIKGVIHFAALKSVSDSFIQPLRYYENNVGGTIALLEAMQKNGVYTLVFSSSATVYGDPETLPLTEDAPCSVTNPYGRTKLQMEEVLADIAQAQHNQWRIARLRYFNPVGAHSSGWIGEDPAGAPANLMPFVAQVAAGQRECVQVFGNDYSTPDGTGQRDYLHVDDLAAGHVAALTYLSSHMGLLTVNLGTGRPYSVLELIRAFEQTCGRSIPFEITNRRPGDVARCWADPARARNLMGWQAQYGLERMCADAWRWQSGSIRASLIS